MALGDDRGIFYNEKYSLFIIMLNSHGSDNVLGVIFLLGNAIFS